MNEPIWENGLPQNLEAAALDGLEWLRVVRARLGRENAREFWNDRYRLDRAIAALELFLGTPTQQPHDPAGATGEGKEAEA